MGICQLWEIVSYVCSGLAPPTVKWHKKNINSADRKHSTNIPSKMMMSIMVKKGLKDVDDVVEKRVIGC